MTEQEKLAGEYKNYRKQCGYEDPVALDEVEGAYYMGMLKQKDLIIKKACEWLKENKDKYLYNTGEKGEYIPVCSSKIVDEFRKYMKGE